jgi:hypothetical protein
MSVRSYSDIRYQIARELDDLTAPAAREAVIEHLTELTFELSRIKEQQRTLLAALRARDILLRENSQTGAIASAGPIELDPRDALDAADGLYNIEWDSEIAYRWTGPGRDTLIRVWLDRAIPIVCEIALRCYGDARNKGAIALTVDGAPVAIEEVGDNLLRSDSFPIAGGSLYSAIRIHVPWLTGAAAPEDDAAGARSSGGRRNRRPRAPRNGTADGVGNERVRGIAVTRIRFLSPA